MQYYIGIDGGGTNTKCVLANGLLKVIVESNGRASNPLVVGFENSAKIIFRLVKKVCYKSLIKDEITLVAGIAGCGSKANSQKLKRLLLEKISASKFSFQNLEVVSDAQIALDGALNGKPGAIIIAGTGSILFGKDYSGKFFKIGGYGKLIGDEGSGYSIGTKGLNAVSKYFDGRGSKSKIADYFSNELGINNREEMIAKVYSGKFDIANVSQLVLKAADNGDETCRQIIDNEIKELLLHIKAFKKNVNGKKLTLSFAGSLLTNNNYYSQGLKRKVNAEFKNVRIIKAKNPPVTGAVILAKNLSPGKTKND